MLQASVLGKQTRSVDWSRATSLAGYDMGADGWGSLIESASAGNAAAWTMCQQVRDASYPYLTEQERVAWGAAGMTQAENSWWSTTIMGNLPSGIQTSMNSMAAAAGAAAGKTGGKEAGDRLSKTAMIALAVLILFLFLFWR